MKFLSTIFLSVLLCTCANASPLTPVKVDNPRATMKTYLDAMKDYNKGRKESSADLKLRINDASRTLDLSEYPPLIRSEKGREISILLKEVIDRVILIDLEKVPEDPNLLSWRLKDTEITIRKIEEGDSAGDFLFSQDTVKRVPDFYKKVKHLPYVSAQVNGAGYSQPFQEKWLPEWAQDNFLGLKKVQWIGLLLSIFIGLILKAVGEYLIAILASLTQKQEGSLRNKVLHSVEKPIGLSLASAFWYFCTHLLKFEGFALSLLINTAQLVFSLSIVWAAYRLTDVLTEVFKRAADKTDNELDDQLVPLLSKSLRVFVVVIGTLVTIQNLGFNVMSLLAGLGLGGLAFALAAKDTAANFFGSIMILIDQPFKVGDWIVTNKAEGTVEEIGFRSTRLRTFYNSVVSVPNMQIANENIDNMGKRQYRRVRSTLGLTYDTSPEKMEAFLEGIKNIIKANPHTRKDYFHVVFNEYADFSLNVLVYFFLEVGDWSNELVEKQNVFLEILRLAKEIDVQFAFPTQSLLIEQFPEKQPLRKEKLYSQKELTEKAREFGKGGELSSPQGRGIFVPAFREEL